jgi:hypothetical protein
MAQFFFIARIKNKLLPENRGGKFWRSGNDDNGDLGSDGDVGDWDSHSPAATSTEGVVAKILASFKVAMSTGLDFLEIGKSSRYDTAIDQGTSQYVFAVPSTKVQVNMHLQCPQARAHIHQGAHNCPLISLDLIAT